MPEPKNVSEVCELILAQHAPESGGVMFVTLAYPDGLNWRVGNAGVGGGYALMDVLATFIARQEPSLRNYALERISHDEAVRR